MTLMEMQALLTSYVKAVRAYNRASKTKEQVQQRQADLSLAYSSLWNPFSSTFPERSYNYTTTGKWRLVHIAYCLSRGRTYEQIEKPVRKPLSDIDWKVIEHIRSQITIPDTATS